MTTLDAIENILSQREMSTRGPTLAPMREALRLLDYKPHQHVVVVAGTNGKGSTSSTLAHCLECAGFKVGLFTSPHLISITERIRLNGQDIPETVFIALFDELFPIVEHLPLTRFEILALMAIRHFAEVDWMILEVGVGGRFDAVNAIPHGFSVITKLGLDHVKLLGPTLKEVAWNKLGVVSPHSTVVHTPFPEEALQVKEQLQMDCQWIESIPVAYKAIKGIFPQFIIQTPWGDAEIALPGVRGAENTALALTALAALGVDPTPCLPALKTLRWPGRMELIATSPCRTFLSGDHNEQGARSLIELLGAYEFKRVHLVVGVGADKQNVLEILETIPDSVLYLTETPFKGRSLKSLSEWVDRAEFSHSDPIQAFKAAQTRADADDLIVVTGSLYLVGALRAHILKG